MIPSKLHLVAHVLCPYVQRSVIVLLEKDIAYTRTDINLANPPDWFIPLSPMGKVPVLSINENIENEKKSLFESAVICEYLDEITPGSLHPDNPLEKAYHRSWIEFGSGILDSIGGLYNAKDKQSFENKRIEIQKKFQLVEKELSNGPYFSGEKFHFIDTVYGPVFRYFDVFEDIVELNIFAGLPKVKVWRHSLQQRSSVQRAVATEYPELLLQFLSERKSFISTFISKEAA